MHAEQARVCFRSVLEYCKEELYCSLIRSDQGMNYYFRLVSRDVLTNLTDVSEDTMHCCRLVEPVLSFSFHILVYGLYIESCLLFKFEIKVLNKNFLFVCTFTCKTDIVSAFGMRGRGTIRWILPCSPIDSGERI